MHHFVHFLKLLGHGLNFCMQLLVLSILVIEHSPVLVPLLVCADAWVLPVKKKFAEPLFDVKIISKINMMVRKAISQNLTKSYLFSQNIFFQAFF